MSPLITAILHHLTLLRLPAARGLALFLALFTLLNILGARLSPSFDANAWWLDLRYLPDWLSHLSLTLASLGLLAFAVGFPEHPITRRLIATSTALLTAAASWNVFVFYFLWFFGRIHPGIFFPLSMLLSAVLSFILRESLLPWPLQHRFQRITLLIVFLASFILFPLAQMYCFGKTDYRRHADAIIVFGAKVESDGTPSQALADRTNTAIHLYHSGLAKFLIFSGGPGPGPISEPQAMRTLALNAGVPDSAIILDERGLNTDDSVQNTLPIFRQHHFKTILAVSHFYHLPRIKMTYQRALFNDSHIEILTVPADESAPLTAMPFYITREVAALWVYYLRPLVGR